MSELSRRRLAWRWSHWLFEPYYLLAGIVLGGSQLVVGHFLWFVMFQPDATVWSPGAGSLVTTFFAMLIANACVLPALGVVSRHNSAGRAEARFFIALGMICIVESLIILLGWVCLLPLLHGLLPADAAFQSFRWSVAALMVGSALCALWGFTLGQARLHVTHHKVSLPEWSGALSGLRLLHLSDLHIGNGVQGPRLQAMVDRANALEPDIVVITGDLFDFDPSHVESGARILQKLEARHGIYAVLGNHDAYTGLETVTRGLRVHAPKLRLLRDEVVSLSEWDLDILGIEDVGCIWSRTPLQLPSLDRLARARAQGRPTLLLSHRPQVFKQAERLGYPLVLSGHTHGGQVALPLFPHVNIARFIGYYDRGWYRWGQSQLLVSRGVGSSGPALRINCSREIVLLEFQ